MSKKPAAATKLFVRFMQLLLESCSPNSIGQFGGKSLYPTNRIGLHTLRNGFNNSDYVAILSSENWP
jgi:hypothetical protein